MTNERTTAEIADIIVAFNSLPLPSRMKNAANVLEDASRRHYKEMVAKVDEIDWRPANLRYVADGWEFEDDKANQVTELAQLLYTSGSTSQFPFFDSQTEGVRDRWIAAAKAAIDAGWTKP
jgi:hypothetical protein